MSKQSLLRFATARTVYIVLAVLLLSLAFSTTVLAAPIAQEQQPGDQQCKNCHGPEAAAWEKSPHAVKGVTCETCHGAYVEGHPDKGVMQLTSDPKICMGCHTETSSQWQHSKHALANVACTSCHVSHSQDTRLSNQWLCGSCHSDEIQDFTHSAHYEAGVTCINCHASKTDSTAMGGAPSHSFTVIDTQACLDCHSKTIHEQVKPVGVTASLQPVAVTTDNNQELATQYDTLKRNFQTLKAVSVINLGVGLGVGGLLGIVFVLGVFFLTGRGGKAK